MKKTISKCVVLLLFVVSCEDNTGYDASPSAVPDNVAMPGEEYVNDWIRVKFTRETGDYIRLATGENGAIQTEVAEIDEMMNRLGITKIESVFSEGGKFRERRREAGLHLWYDVYTGNLSSQAETRAVNDLAELPFITLTERIPVYKQEESAADKYINQPYSLASEANSGYAPEAEPYPFNDPELSRQWYLYNPGSGTNSIAGADINVFPAWKSVTGGRSDVIVAVLDGGIDYNHPDLKANMWVNAGEIAGNGIDDDNNGFVDDIYGYRWGYSRTTVPKVDPSGEILPLDHGTHVAGIIGAVNNNGIGVCGVAGGTGKKDGVRLMSCQVFIPNYSTTKTPYDYGETHSVDRIADAYPYAADNGAVIASCSFSAGTNSYKEAIDYFIKNAGTDEKGNQTGPMKGGIVICAAANDGVDTPVYPAAYEKCISVAGLCWNYVKSSNSNYGNWVTLSAFFGGGYSTASQIYSTYPTASLNGSPAGSGYGFKIGTSQACPQVSGLAALIVSKYGGPGFTPDEVKELLLNTARNVDAYNPGYVGKLGVGMIDAYAALTGKVDVVVDMNPVTDLTGVWDTYSVSLTWSDPNGSGVTEYDIYWSQNSLADVSPEALPSGVKTARIKN
ncbi:Thermophilic serine proteinase, partial [termite gut metagenome]